MQCHAYMQLALPYCVGLHLAASTHRHSITSVHTANDGTLEITRVCTLLFYTPSSVIHIFYIFPSLARRNDYGF